MNKKRKQEKATITVRKKHKVTLQGHPDAVREVVAIFFRGAAELHIAEQQALGRSREEVVEVMLSRIRIAEQHYKLGESDGYKCDLRDA